MSLGPRGIIFSLLLSSGLSACGKIESKAIVQEVLTEEKIVQPSQDDAEQGVNYLVCLTSAPMTQI